MSRPTSEHPTELELQILKILWQSSPQLVRDIRDALANAGRDIAHTSVTTALTTMFDKGYLKRKKRNNAFLFSPDITEDEVSEKMVGNLVNRMFDGSASALMLNLFEKSEIDEEELKELRRTLNRKLRESK